MDVLTTGGKYGATPWTGITRYICGSNGYFASQGSEYVVSEVNTSLTDGRSDALNNGTLTHELGHALGLGNSNTNTALMWPYDSDRQAYAYYPRPADTDGVNWLY